MELGVPWNWMERWKNRVPGGGGELSLGFGFVLGLAPARMLVDVVAKAGDCAFVSVFCLWCQQLVVKYVGFWCRLSVALNSPPGCWALVESLV